MALNPNIPLSARPMQIQSPMEGAQQMLTLRELMMGAQVQEARRDQLRMAQAQAARQQQADMAFRSGLQQAGRMTPEIASLGLAAGYSPADLQGLAGMSNWGRPEVAGTVERAGGATGKETLFRDKYGNLIGDPIAAPVEARRFDAGGVSIAENPYTLAEVGRTQKTLTPEAVLTDQRTRSEGALNRGVTIRGQNLTDARARAEQEFRLNNPTRQWMETTDGVVGLDSRGVAPPIQAVGPDGRPLPGKPLTESQSNSVNYANRMLESHKTLTDLEDTLSGAAIAGLASKEGVSRLWGIGGALGAAGNLMLSENQQKYEQAQRDFVNAVLRKESGAVISDEEFDNAKKQYFPQPGDSEAVLEQKRQNRVRAITGISSGAGPRQPDILRGLSKYEFERKKKAEKKNGGQKAEGNVGGAPAEPQPPAVGQTFTDMPDPAQYKGVAMRDKQTGITYQSDGKSWRAVK